MAVGSRPLGPVPAGAGRRSARRQAAGATHDARRLRRAHQAADHRAAADHDGADDGPGRTRWPSLGWLVIVTLVGGTLAAGGANAINMVVDRDIDRLMPRTQGRPLVTGVIAPASRRWSSPSASRSLAFAVLWALRQPAVGRAGALARRLFYVFVYTLWLKRTSHAEHRHRRRRRGGAGAGGLGGRDRHRSAGRRSCCSPSCSSGPRRTSGPWPSATPTTTAPPTCRCCRRWPARRSRRRKMLGYTVALWVAAPSCSIPVADLGSIYTVTAAGARRRVLRRVPRLLRRNPPPDGRCGSSASPSPTSRCCSPRWPSTPWCVTGGSRPAEGFPDPRVHMGSVRRRHANLRFLIVTMTVNVTIAARGAAMTITDNPPEVHAKAEPAAAVVAPERRPAPCPRASPGG